MTFNCKYFFAYEWIPDFLQFVLHTVIKVIQNMNKIMC